MTSRDARASYYDLELPDGTRTEVWSVLRAVLSPEEALGYTKGCLLTRIMRDGRKGVDRLREAEKVGIEAGMLREAMAAYLATPDPLTAALDAVDMRGPSAYCPGANGHTCDRGRLVECDEHGETDAGPCPRCNPPPPQTYRDRIAELERERDEAWEEIFAENKRHALTVQESNRWRQTAERAQADLDALRTTLETERQAAVATAEELERVRKRLADLHKEQSAANALLATIRDEVGVSAAHEAPAEVVRVKAALRTEYERLDSEIRVGRELRSRIVDLERELAALRDRYRPRRQSEEPAPEGTKVLAWYPDAQSWMLTDGDSITGCVTWTRQPPAPGEGE